MTNTNDHNGPPMHTKFALPDQLHRFDTIRQPLLAKDMQVPCEDSFGSEAAVKKSEVVRLGNPDAP